MQDDLHAITWAKSFTATCNHQGLGIRVSFIAHCGESHCILWKCTGPNPFPTILGLYILIQSTIVWYGNNVQVQTHFTLFQGCIYSSNYIIVSYGNVQVQTHFTVFQGCIFSSKVQCVRTACGPNFATT